MALLAKVDALISQVYPGYRQFSKFLSVGVIATLVDWAIFYLLAGYLGIFYLLSLAVSYLASTVLNFFVNRRFTFGNKSRKIHVQFMSFIAIALVGLALNEAIIYGLVHYLFSSTAGPVVMASRIIATLVVFLWNFVLNKSITFHVFR